MSEQYPRELVAAVALAIGQAGPEYMPPNVLRKQAQATLAAIDASGTHRVVQTDTLTKLADELCAVALSLNRLQPRRAFEASKVSRIANKLRDLAGQPHAVLGQPDEAQAPYVEARPCCSSSAPADIILPYGETLD